MWRGSNSGLVLFLLALLFAPPTFSAQTFVTEFRLTPIAGLSGATLVNNLLTFLNSLATGVPLTAGDIQIHNHTTA